MQKQSKTSSFFLAVLFIGFLVLSLPFSQNMIVTGVEKLMGRTLRDPGRWREIIMHCSFIAMSVLGIVFFLTHTLKGCAFLVEIKSESKNLVLFYKERRTLLFLLGCFCFYFFAYYKIIDANFLYADDLWRSYEGSRSWIGFSRYISEFLSIVLHTNVYLPDIAPLTQFISLALMAFTTVLLSFVLSGKRINVLSLLALSLAFISPYFSENFSYRFDSPYMTLAVFFPVIPFVFSNADKKIFSFVSVISIILGCMCYQAGSSVYILLALYIGLKKYTEEKNLKDVLSFLGISALSFIIAMVVFRLLFMNTLSNDSYVSASIGIGSLARNIKSYFIITISLFGNVWMKIFLLIIVVFNLIYFSLNLFRNKIISLAVGVIFLAVTFVLSFGPYIIFERTLLAPRAFLGFNMFIALLCFNCINRKRVLVKASVVALAYGCVVFLFVYGNCLDKQGEYQRFRTELLLSDLNEYAVPENMTYLSFSGGIGNSDGYKVARGEYLLLERLIPCVPSSKHIWNDDYINTYKFSCEDESLPADHDFPLLKSTYYHDIYGKENHFYIELK